MNDVTFRAAKKGDVRRIKSLLRRADLPYEDIGLAGQDMIVAVQGTKILGAVGLEPYGDCGLLRSLVVEEGLRGHGLGKALADEIVAHAKKAGVKRLYC